MIKHCSKTVFASINCFILTLHYKLQLNTGNNGVHIPTPDQIIRKIQFGRFVMEFPYSQINGYYYRSTPYEKNKIVVNVTKSNYYY